MPYALCKKVCSPVLNRLSCYYFTLQVKIRLYEKRQRIVNCKYFIRLILQPRINSSNVLCNAREVVDTTLFGIPWWISTKKTDREETAKKLSIISNCLFFLIKNYTERYPIIRLLLAWIHTSVLPRFMAGYRHGEKKDRGLQLRSLLTSR